MANSPLTKVQLNGAEAAFMLGAADDADTVENVDVEVTLDDGSRWSATFLTLAEIRRLMERWEATGECFSGAYFQCADLVIVGQGGIAAAADLLRQLVDSGRIREVLVRIDIEE
ncbi:hypothetical protein E1258_26650 [Micromonospora sp. KC207]|uniref:hypothetical protein n=1 Tax=Micromonospora sp. KC207 TaxID=2530377 RepID=UPI0010477DFB|nr:hypothetical protein [Micromonospora sp. KC207]TDC50152.1 hypothetical protein E1258_26650 [Micromonospora sp. KC207]